MSLRSGMLSLMALVASLAPLASAHSWVEEYQVISPNGSFVGARGYSRGYVSRTDPTYDGFSMMWMLPDLTARNGDGTTRTRINSSDFVCHAAQRTSNYTTSYPKLEVQPGDYVAMKYLENGHVSLPWNITGKPPGTGTVFVFGTTNPSDGEKIVDVMKWNKAGTGGNKRGFLMTAQNFDDGRCHQINCGGISQQRQMLHPNHVAGQPTSTVESWCESDLKIPESATPGTLTTYWIWQWPTEPNNDCNAPAGKDEYYTTCADFDIVESGTNNNGNHSMKSPFSAAPGANPQSTAVANFQSRPVYTPTPSVILMEHNKIIGSLAPVAPKFVSACSTQAPIISAHNLALWPEVFVPNSCAVISTFGPAAATAAAKLFASASAEYASGSKSAWEAAFSGAMPTRIPWSQAVTSTPPSYPTPSTSIPAPLSTTAPPYYTNTTRPLISITSTLSPTQSQSVDIVTLTTVVVITSTLAPGESIPTSSPTPAPLSASFANSDGIGTVMTASETTAPVYRRRRAVGGRHPRDFR